MSKKIKNLWAFDCETDPFKYGRVPEPFLWCAISEHGERRIFWGNDCTEKFIEFLLELPPSVFISHNGGKFDTQLLIKYITGKALIVDGRILKCFIGNAELRDSMAILPMPLAKLDKTSSGKIKIDLDKLEKEKRQKYKQEIINYCLRDCDVLMSAVQSFYKMAGRRALTIASVASEKLRELYPDLPKLNKSHYEEFKPFYFGGRVGVLKGVGEFSGNFKLYDVNSMYPAVMRNFNHPWGNSYSLLPFSLENIPEHGAGFFEGAAYITGCFPIRDDLGNTPYPTGYFTNIKVTIAELIVALKHNLVEKIHGRLIIPNNYTNFAKFVDFFYEARQAAKKLKNHGEELFYKLILNSAYGRFCMSPDGRYAFYITGEEDKIEFKKSDDGNKIKLNDDAQLYDVEFIDTINERYILKREVDRPWTFYEDIATGASITGAARAMLLDAMCQAQDPMYCDTDSLLCESLPQELLDNSRLGAWKLECEGDRIFIGGKKMYAIYKKSHIMKKASKGVRMTGKHIAIVSRGGEVTLRRDAPALNISRGVRFTERKIRITK